VALDLGEDLVDHDIFGDGLAERDISRCIAENVSAS
jgi:hypothetical protein